LQLLLENGEPLLGCGNLGFVSVQAFLDCGNLLPQNLLFCGECSPAGLQL
jgi:hypothetical protein